MKKQAIFIILLITCALGVHANDSITVSASDLQALMQRVERLEQKAAQDSASQQMGRSKQSEVSAQKSEPRRGRFTIGGYGEVTAKHCWYSNNYLRYGQHPEKYANLRVRVSGFSGYFVKMRKEVQDEIIARLVASVR